MMGREGGREGRTKERGGGGQWREEWQHTECRTRYVSRDGSVHTCLPTRIAMCCVFLLFVRFALEVMNWAKQWRGTGWDGMGWGRVGGGHTWLVGCG